MYQGPAVWWGPDCSTLFLLRHHCARLGGCVPLTEGNALTAGVVWHSGVWGGFSPFWEWAITCEFLAGCWGPLLQSGRISVTPTCTFGLIDGLNAERGFRFGALAAFGGRVLSAGRKVSLYFPLYRPGQCVQPLPDAHFVLHQQLGLHHVAVKFNNLRHIIPPFLGWGRMLSQFTQQIQATELLAQIESRLATIAWLGRAFGVHLILATQRPHANIIPGQIKNNLDFRVCGRADNVLSQIILDNTSAADQIPKDARGRFITGNGTVFQGYLFDEGQL